MPMCSQAYKAYNKKARIEFAIKKIAGCVSIYEGRNVLICYCVDTRLTVWVTRLTTC